MDIHIINKAHKKKEEHDKMQSVAFQDFMEEPLTRNAISSLGLDNVKMETLYLVLSASHKNGFQHGIAMAIMDITHTLEKHIQKEG